MTAHQINLSIFPMAEALPDSRLNASRIEFAVSRDVPIIVEIEEAALLASSL